MRFDPAEPGRECSFGNAGIIATSEIFPIISPAHMRRLPHMLLSRDAPASIRPTALPCLLPWLWRAAATLPRARQLSITATLCDIRSEEHTSELQSLMRSSYAVFCL